MACTAKADADFQRHLQCVLRAALASGRNPSIRLTVVGGSFSIGNGGVGPERRWSRLLFDWLDEALQLVGGAAQSTLPNTEVWEVL